MSESYLIRTQILHSASRFAFLTPRIPACYAGDRGSIPRREEPFLGWDSIKYICDHFARTQ